MNFSEWILVLIFLAISAFLSLSEISLIGLSKVRLRHMIDRGIRRAKLVRELISNLDHVITTILICSNFANAALTSVVTAAFILWLGQRWGVIAASLTAGTLVLLVTDIIPKIYASRHAEQASLRVAYPMSLLVILFWPLAEAVSKVTWAVLKVLGVPVQKRSPLVTEEELRLMIEMGKEEGVLGEHERKLLHRIFEFGDLKVADVMVPLEKMVCVPDTATHEEILTVLTEEGHSRLPVYHGLPSRISGILYAQELLHIWREGWLIVLQDLIHPPYEVPPTTRVIELLQEFQRRKVQIALVVNAKSEVLGLITLEDLIEEIVGEIDETTPGMGS